MNIIDRNFLLELFDGRNIEEVIYPDISAQMNRDTFTNGDTFAGYILSGSLFKYSYEGSSFHYALEQINIPEEISYSVEGTGIYRTNHGYPKVMKPSSGFQTQNPSVLTIRYDGNIQTYAINVNSDNSWTFDNNNPGIPDNAEVEILATIITPAAVIKANDFRHVIFDEVIQADNCFFVGYKILL